MYKIMCPSMMCADFGHLADEIARLEDADIDIFHIDFMDGSFVPNFGMGLQDFEYICKTANKPVDAHLMIYNPIAYVQKFADIGAEIIYIHPESDIHAARTLQKIIDAGAKPGICINPGTSLESVKELLPLTRYFMVMTVNPGFAGQKYLDFVDEKIAKIAGLKEQFDYKIVVDGAISPVVIKRLSIIGVDGFVLGTSSLFRKDTKSYKQIIEELRKL